MTNLPTTGDTHEEPRVDEAALLQWMVASAPLAVQIFRSDGDCVVANATALTLFGRASFNGYNVFRDELALSTGFDGLVHRAFAGETAQSSAIWFSARDSDSPRKIAIEASAFPIVGPDGRTAYVGACFRDETMEATAREEASRARQTLEAIISASPLAIALVDLDGTTRMWNPAAEKLFGWSAKEAIGGLPPNLAPEQVREFRERLARAARGEVIAGGETTRRRRSGETVDVEVWTAPVGDRTPTQAVAIVADITDRKHTENARHEAAARLQILADASSVFAAAVVTPAAIVQRIASFVASTLGDACAISLADESGLSVRAVAVEHPDPTHRDLFAAVFERPFRIDEGLPGKVLRTGQSLLIPVFDPRIVPATARAETHAYFEAARPHSIAMSPLSLRGKTRGVLGILRERPGPSYGPEDVRLLEDIAHRAALAIENADLLASARAAEERSAFLAEATKILNSSLDYETSMRRLVRVAVPRAADVAIVIDWSESGEIGDVVIAHQDPASEALVAELLRLGPRYADDSPMLEEIRRTGATRVVDDYGPLMVRASRDSERARTIVQSLGVRSLVNTPIRTRDRVVGVISLGWNETRGHPQPDDVALAEELGRRAGLAVDNANLYQSAREATRLRDEFLGTISHELRTPLNAVLGWATIARSNPNDPMRTAHALAVIERNARVQARLIADVLDATRIISGKLQLETQRVDLVSLARAAIETHQLSASEKGITIVFDPSNVTDPIVADPSRLQQAFTNLVSNAVNFTPKGGRVEFSLRHSRDVLEVRVKDTGEGIDPSFLPHLFERFRQGDPSASRRHGGLGLGLAITRQIVELHGGTASAVSEGVGRGSVFTIRLPLRGNRVPALATSEIAPRSRMSGAADFTGVRVLIVEDEADARDAVAFLFERAGATVRTADTGLAALEELASAPPDLLVCDVGMPDMDGYALLRRAGQLEYAKPKSIALTAYAGSDDIRRAKEAGFDVHLAKPIDMSTLLGSAAQLIAQTS